MHLLSSRTTSDSLVSSNACSRKIAMSSMSLTTARPGPRFAEDPAGIDVVILDVGLPDMSGLDVARRLRRSQPELAILMLTARDTVGDRVTGLDAGADDYLVKPFAYEELAAAPAGLARRAAGRAPRGAAPRSRPDQARRGVATGDRRRPRRRPQPARVLAAGVPSPPPWPDA